MSTGTYSAPLGRFLAQLDEVRSGDVLDMRGVGRLLMELAAEQEYFVPLIAQIPAASPGVHWLARPEWGRA